MPNPLQDASSPFSGVDYDPNVAHSPYVSHARFENPKENFKHVLRKLQEITDASRSYRYCDIACANGELLYFLRQHFPHWEFHGFDFTSEFIELGRSFEGLAGVRLETKDFFDIEESFDIVSCLGTLHTFWDLEQPLNKLLGLCEPGGILLADGAFNPHDVELRCVYMDNSKPESRGEWRRDFSQHSRSSVGALLEGKCQSFEFEDVEMGVDLPRKPGAPDINVWTVKTEDGRRLVVNGAQLILDKTLLTVRR